MKMRSKIRELRRSKGISLRQLAAAVGVHDGQLSKIERGIIQSPSIHLLQRIKIHLGVERIEDLYEEDENDNV